MQTRAVVRGASKSAPASGPKVTPAVGLWVPKTEQMLMIELPGERLLAQVVKVVNPDVVICELVNTPLMTKNHHYERGAFVPVERTRTPLETVWRAFKPTPRAAPGPKRRRKKVAT